MWAAGPIDRLARLTSLLVRYLTASNRFVLHLLRLTGDSSSDADRREKTTQDCLRSHGGMLSVHFRANKKVF